MVLGTRKGTSSCFCLSLTNLITVTMFSCAAIANSRHQVNNLGKITVAGSTRTCLPGHRSEVSDDGQNAGTCLRHSNPTLCLIRSANRLYLNLTETGTDGRFRLAFGQGADQILADIPSSSARSLRVHAGPIVPPTTVIGVACLNLYDTLRLK